MKARDAIAQMIRGIVERERPKPRVCEVYSFNRFSRVAEVLLPGETDANSTLQARFPEHLQPTKSKSVDGAGDLVLVEGTLGSYRITQLVSGSAAAYSMQLGDVTLMGGKLRDRAMVRHFSREVDLPGSGASVHLGRFYFKHDLDYNFQAWSAYAELVVESRVYFGGSKTYRFAVDNSAITATWRNIFPDKDSGFRYGNDFAVEIFVADDHSFELRVRNVRSNSTAPPQGYVFSLWLNGQDWDYDDTNYNKFDAGVSPGVPFRTDDVNANETVDGWNVVQGPYFEPQKRIVHGRTWEHVTGGGTISWSDKYVLWTNNLVASIGRTNLITNGVVQIGPPTVGQSIYYHGFTGGTLTIAYTASGVDMMPVAATHSVLYYAPDFGSADGANGRYHVVGNDLNFKVPSHWIMIAVMNQTWDYLKLATGHCIRPWQTVVSGELVQPRLRGIQSALVSLATSGSFQTITNWTEQITNSWVTYSAGVWTFNAPGSWDLRFMMTTASNATGSRAVRINKNNGTIIAQIQSKAADTSLATGVFVAKDISMAVGDTIRFDGMQSAGVALNTVPGENFTYYSMKRTGP
jgi:hypothetical protein